MARSTWTSRQERWFLRVWTHQKMEWKIAEELFVKIWTWSLSSRHVLCCERFQFDIPSMTLDPGIGVTNLGHCHPQVTEAVREQLGKLWHAQAIQWLWALWFWKPQQTEPCCCPVAGAKQLKVNESGIRGDRTLNSRTWDQLSWHVLILIDFCWLTG